MADLQHEFVVDDDMLRIAAQCVAGRIGGRTIIGANKAVFTILLQPFVARCAMLATVYQTADADRIADLEFRHMVADGGHMADDFMPRHARIERSAPFAAHLMQVGMANAAIGDGDGDIVRAGRAAFDVHGFNGLVGGICAKGLGQHGGLPEYKERSIGGV